ncbi:short-chain dehydrogenase [Microbacterium mangrovi]|uniref:Short-chain dehydrogenase n=1 Tax=Microbacterium mangrovi TaxID=1348253 RepID=A0A0B2AB75_9MICO|nr:short chain dehydrogenase [Microbacterium mangrovi]KHK98832.1 short-chain dehydrogenase [Microbacterium mangrovi]
MTVVIIGASGHVGAAAAAALRPHHDLVEVGRSTQPPVDLEQPDSIQALFAEIGSVDAIVSTVGHVPFLPLEDLSRDDYLRAFTGKVLNQIDLVRIATPFVRDGGSITLTSGVVGRVPIAAGVAAAMANGAVEAFVRAAAVELPRGIRINVVSPNVLATAEAFHSSFPGLSPVSDHVVGQAFRRAVDGLSTGEVLAAD